MAPSLLLDQRQVTPSSRVVVQRVLFCLTGNGVLGVAAVLELDEGEPHPDVDFLNKTKNKYGVINKKPTRRVTYTADTQRKAKNAATTPAEMYTLQQQQW